MYVSASDVCLLCFFIADSFLSEALYSGTVCSHRISTAGGSQAKGGQVPVLQAYKHPPLLLYPSLILPPAQGERERERGLNERVYPVLITPPRLRGSLSVALWRLAWWQTLCRCLPPKSLSVDKRVWLSEMERDCVWHLRLYCLGPCSMCVHVFVCLSLFVCVCVCTCVSALQCVCIW